MSHRLSEADRAQLEKNLETLTRLGDPFLTDEFAQMMLTAPSIMPPIMPPIIRRLLALDAEIENTP